MKKRMLSLLLAVLMVFSMLPVSALAEETPPDSGSSATTPAATTTPETPETKETPEEPEHEHEYTYKYISTGQHTATCACGDSRTEDCTLDDDRLDGNYCLLCGGNLDDAGSDTPSTLDASLDGTSEETPTLSNDTLSKLNLQVEVRDIATKNILYTRKLTDSKQGTDYTITSYTSETNPNAYSYTITITNETAYLNAGETFVNGVGECKAIDIKLNNDGTIVYGSPKFVLNVKLPVYVYTQTVGSDLKKIELSSADLDRLGLEYDTNRNWVVLGKLDLSSYTLAAAKDALASGFTAQNSNIKLPTSVVEFTKTPGLVKNIPHFGYGSLGAHNAYHLDGVTVFYKVTFDANANGDYIDKMPVPAYAYYYGGEAFEAPTTLRRVGYNFTGWYTDKDCKNKAPEKITKDITLYAGWELKTSNVTLVIYKSNDLSTPVFTKRIATDKKALDTIDLTGIKLTDYYSGSYDVVAGPFDDGLFNSYRENNSTKTLASPLTISGNPQSIKYIIVDRYPVYVYAKTVDSSGNALEVPAADMNRLGFKYNDATEKVGGKSLKVWMTLGELDTEQTLTEKSYADTSDVFKAVATEAKTEKLNHSYNKTIPLDAVNFNSLERKYYKGHNGFTSSNADSKGYWNAYHLDGTLKFFNVAFSANTTDAVTGMPTGGYYCEGEKITLPTLTREGYTFRGWAVAGAEYVDPNSKYAGGAEYTVTKDVKLIADWTPLYSLTYDANAGGDTTVANMPENVTGSETSTFDIPTAVPTRKGYTFLGWSPNKTLTNGETPIKPGTLYNNNNPRGITLYAIWEANTYNIAATMWVNDATDAYKGNLSYAWSYRYGGKYGETINYQPMIDAIKAKALEADAANKPNSSKVDVELCFTGDWDKRFDDAIKTYGQEDANWQKDNNNTAYIWARAYTYYDVTFETGEGTPVEAQLVRNGKTATEPTAPTRNGYRFLGWVANDGTAYNFDTPVTKSMTLTATWEAIPVYVYVTPVDKDNNHIVLNSIVLNRLNLTANSCDGVNSQWFNVGKLVTSVALTDPATMSVNDVFSLSDEQRTTLKKELVDGTTLTHVEGNDRLKGSIFNVITLSNPKVEKQHFIDSYSGNAYHVDGRLMFFNVTFDANANDDISVENLPTGGYYYNSEPFTLPTTEPTRAGYNFGGWYLDADCKNACSLTSITADTTIYAKWVALPVYVYAQTVDASRAPVTLSESDLTRLGLAYNDDSNTWVTLGSLDLAGAAYTVENATTALASGFTAHSTNTKAFPLTKVGQLWLQKCENQEHLGYSVEGAHYDAFHLNGEITFYSVTFNENTTDTVDGMPTGGYYYGGESFTLPTTAPTRAGYNFGGWYLDADCNTAFESGSAITADTTIYAKWTPRADLTCTIRYVKKGTTTEIRKADTVENLTYGTEYTAKAPSISGYRLSGSSEKTITVGLENEIVFEYTRRSSSTSTSSSTSKKAPTLKFNTADHDAYIKGYPDGTVRPQGTITRAEVATILYRIMDEDCREAYYTTKNSFYDVSSSKWYNTYISTLAKAGVIVDSNNGYFRPDEPITRAELAVMMAQFTATTASTNNFSDVSRYHWAADEIAVAEKMGWIKGYPDGTFRPDATITRAEMVTMINRALGRLPSSEDRLVSVSRMTTFPDCTPNDWFYLAVQEAANGHTYRAIGKDGDEEWISIVK